MKEKISNSTIYWIYDYHLAAKHDADGLKLRKLLDSGLIDILQFRAKEITRSEYEMWIDKFSPDLQNRQTVILANDFVESVLKLGLDGVHVGQNDMPVKFVKNMLGKDLIVGVTARNLEHVKNAELQNADYVGAGTVFNTETKQGLVAQGPKFIADLIAQSKIPIFPIGGINLNNLSTLVEAGIHRVALSSALLTDNEPVYLVKKMRQMLLS